MSLLKCSRLTMPNLAFSRLFLTKKGNLSHNKRHITIVYKSTFSVFLMYLIITNKSFLSMKLDCKEVYKLTQVFIWFLNINVSTLVVDPRSFILIIPFLTHLFTLSSNKKKKKKIIIGPSHRIHFFFLLWFLHLFMMFFFFLLL